MLILEYPIELIHKSIDGYSLLNKNQKLLLKALIKISNNLTVLTTIKDLAKILGVTNTTISNSLAALQKYSLILNITKRGVIFTGCEINKAEIDRIILIYKKTRLEKN
jgi:Mn-dependent DtxR family transcriptional regulator